MIDGIRLAYSMLKSKSKDARDETCVNSLQDLVDYILEGSYELINLISDSQDFYEPQLIDLKDRNYDLMASLEKFKRKNERLEQHHRQLVKQMSRIEVENLEVNSEQNRVMLESANLKQKVEELTKSETQAYQNLTQIKSNISEKEE